MFTIIQDKAREIFEELKEQYPGIKHVLMHCEFAGADKEETETTCFEFQEFIEKEGYRSQHIFNCDETSLFWKCMLNCT